MSQLEQLCRYCGVPFSPTQNKPGFVDECPRCLSERRIILHTPPPKKQNARSTLIEELHKYIKQHPPEEEVSPQSPLCELRDYLPELRGNIIADLKREENKEGKEISRAKIQTTFENYRLLVEGYD